MFSLFQFGFVHKLIFFLNYWCTRLERGDFKLRVRASELERAEDRSKLVQSNLFQAVLSCFFLQGSLSVGILGNSLPVAKPLTKVFLAAAAFFAVRVPLGVNKVRQLDKYNQRYVNN